MRLGRDGIAGLIGLAISLFLLPLSFGLPKLPIVPIGPGFYPAIVLVFMAVTSGRARDAGHRRPAAAASASAEEGPAQPKRAYGLVAAAFAVIDAYIVLLPLSRLSHRHGAVRRRLSGRCWSGRRRCVKWAVLTGDRCRHVGS